MDVQIACICLPKVNVAWKDGDPEDTYLMPRHETDTVTLRDVLDFRTTLTVRQEIRFTSAGDSRLTLAELTAVMSEAYLLHCIERWTVKDDKGKPLPVTKANIEDRLLSHYEEAEKVADAADDLYSEKVVLPLLNGASKSSPPIPTPAKSSTSQETNGRTPRKPSKRSSISTTPMVVTGPMAASPGGVSNSSLS